MSASAWFAHRLHPFAQDVGSIVPPDYAAYARIFHPAYRARDVPVRWMDIAVANGRRAHAEMQFGNIAGAWRAPSPRPELWSAPPTSGTLPVALARAIVEILRGYTRTADRCSFAIWEGWGDIDAPADAEWLEFPQRRYFIVRGALELALGPVTPRIGGRYQSASMWWPDDRAWFVSTEVDFSWTYIGAALAAVNAVLGHAELEAQTATIHDRFTWDADTLNPSPGAPFAQGKR